MLCTYWNYNIVYTIPTSKKRSTSWHIPITYQYQEISIPTHTHTHAYIDHTLDTHS